MMMMIIIIKIKRRRDRYSGGKGGLGLTENELFVHEILAERDFKNLCKKYFSFASLHLCSSGVQRKMRLCHEKFRN